MADSKHTPGPWREDTDPGCTGVIGPDGFMVADCMIVSMRKGAPSQERCEANARLIAAAPELVNALRDIVYQKPGDAGAYGRAANLLHRLGVAGAP